jgi:hypothetical protein
MAARQEQRLRNARGELLGTGDRFILYTGGEILDAVSPPSDWGPWQLDTRTWVLYTTRPYRYEVDLEKCLDSAQVLDWIMQIAGKGWADDDTILAGLIRALHDVLDPQGQLCSGGMPKEITKARARELASRAKAQREQSLAVYGGVTP